MLSARTTISDSQSTHRAAWLRECGWGLMFHYLDKPASSNNASSTSAEEWNRRVDSFDVPAFAQSVKTSEAGYVIFTLGQNTGHFCAPNETYDAILGSSTSKLSQRDLIGEIAEALQPEVKLIAYLPCHAPANDAGAVRAFGLNPPWDGNKWGLPANASKILPADERLSAFQRHWEAVITEWGQSWGSSVHGWWIDGCYYHQRMYQHAEGPNWDSFAAALLAGNPARALAFNSGTATPFEKLTDWQNYTAGECSNRLPVANLWEPLTESMDSMQLHVLSYLGQWWGQGKPRFSREFLSAYTKMMNDCGGAITWDVPLDAKGHIDDACQRALESLRVSMTPSDLILD